jgi:hypothetical protein
MSGCLPSPAMAVSMGPARAGSARLRPAGAANVIWVWAPLKAGSFCLSCSTACWDSVPGMLKSSLGSPRRPMPAAATMPSSASQLTSTNHRRR